MSFLHLISSAVDEIIEKFLIEVSFKYKVDKNELQQMWNATSHLQPQPTPTPTPISNPNGALENLNKTELQSHCKARGLKTTGNKQELIARLSGSEPTVTSTKEVTSKKQSVKATGSTSEISKLLKSQIVSVTIERNKFNNYEHSSTHLVFDRASEQVIGKQNPNGQIDSLTEDDIEICNKHKFKYIIPENLNTSSSKANTAVIDELAGDDIEEDQLGEALEDEDDDDLLGCDEEEEEFDMGEGDDEY